MTDRIGKGLLIWILTAAVLLGAYLTFVRIRAESRNRMVELVVDLNDLKKMAACENKPIGPILDQLKKAGVTGIGVFEETLPDANAAGEIYYAKGSGILRLALLSDRKRIKPDRTYIYAPAENVRKRIYNHLEWVLGKGAIQFIGQEIMEINEPEEDLRVLGLGISEMQEDFLKKKGFRIIPRVWNDPRYKAGSIGFKIGALKDHKLVIFDGDEILGYPDAIYTLAKAMKKHRVKYGCVEIVKQDGDQRLKRLMADAVVRVHSVPKDELKKITREEALDRFARAARERSVRLIYVRPFLPPQTDAFPVEYNIKYFSEIRSRLEAAGFSVRRDERPLSVLGVKNWQVLLLGGGVLVGGMFLLSAFFSFPSWLMCLMFAVGAVGMVVMGVAGHFLLLQKGLAFLAAIVFPSSAVIFAFSTTPQKNPLFCVINVLAETSIGIFLMLGLLADSRFMSGVEAFPAVKLALVLPVLIVGLNLVLKAGSGSLRGRILSILNTKVSLLTVFAGAFVLGSLALLVARSGNFVVPVPGFEKYLRNWLELLLFARPRTKEFLIGYPVLYLASLYYLKGNKNWLWLLAAVGAIAPVSVFNTFSHIHTPIMISITRTFNGLVIGLFVGLLVGLAINKYLNNEK